MTNKINNSKLNLSIDFIMFVVLMVVAGIGMLIKYVLVPGFKRNEIYGQDVELYFWGLDRHQWGTIHFILSILLIVLLILHILFHWKQICFVLKRMVKNKTGRVVTWGLSVFILVLFGILPFFIQPVVKDGLTHGGHYQAKQKEDNDLKKEPIMPAKNSFDIVKKESPAQNKKEQRHSIENFTIDIRGSMTLNEVAKKHALSVSELAMNIHVPEEYSNQRLGRLRKQYGFQMDDLREYIKSKKSNDD